MQSEAALGDGLAEEDRLRADMYGFLASLLRSEPSDDLLAQVGSLEGDDSPIGEACATLAKLAGCNPQVSADLFTLQQASVHSFRTPQIWFGWVVLHWRLTASARHCATAPVLH